MNSATAAAHVQVEVGAGDPPGPLPPAVLSWSELKVMTRKTRKVVLNEVTGQIQGGFWAVMGPSGSGKSTLLNALSLRMDPGMQASGEMRLNGRPYGSLELKRASGYVMQDDLLNAHLTVAETLNYTARLRCPPEFTAEQRQERMDEVLAQVGLTHVRDVIVGSPLCKGISGGERKRLCVAMELITRPQLLFCDEPTSGLDSVTALSVCRLLRNLATQCNCTILTTIHQPQSKIFSLFEGLMLLKDGSLVYQGPAEGALQFFADVGYPVPELTNPADHFMDVMIGDRAAGGGGNPSDSSSSLDKLSQSAYDLRLRLKQQVDLGFGKDRPPLKLREMVPWHKQCAVLLERNLKEQARQVGVHATQLVQTMIIAVLIGTVFLQIGTTQSSIVRRQPVLFFCVINQGMFAALMTINSFPAERVLSLRERAAGTYHSSAYFVAKTLVDTSFQLPVPVLFSCIVYFLVGFQPLASKFFIFVGFMVLCSLAATSLALAIGAWCKTTNLSLTVLPMALEVCRLFGGFFLSPSNLPPYFAWLDALSYVKYTYVGISLNELTGLVLTCTPQQLAAAGGKCPITSGQQTIDLLGLDYIPIWGAALALVGFIVLCRALAYLGVRLCKW